jgi:hypothetical protein
MKYIPNYIEQLANSDFIRLKLIEDFKKSLVENGYNYIEYSGCAYDCIDIKKIKSG